MCYVSLNYCLNQIVAAGMQRLKTVSLHGPGITNYKSYRIFYYQEFVYLGKQFFCTIFQMIKSQMFNIILGRCWGEKEVPFFTGKS